MTSGNTNVGKAEHLEKFLRDVLCNNNPQQKSLAESAERDVPYLLRYYMRWTKPEKLGAGNDDWPAEQLEKYG